MDSFINIAKQGYETYSKSQSDVSKTGGSEYNAPHNQSHAPGGPSFDDNDVVNNAAKHGSGESSLFSNALSFLNQNKSQHEEPLDEEGVQAAHKQAYSNDSAGGLDAKSIGSAAALQILKSFTSGGSGSGSASSAGSQTQLISLAMAEASKLFEKSGGGGGGNKQDAVNSAGMTVMKLLVQSKFSGATGGGNSGGLGSMMGLASKFL
ncbi:hypothetical protein PLICRDRAFT_36336 [Plicaturopsis crispa FD-325 SS-3]|nr:hypothetical protein PLICRDRAFT_36336 [Plicaturopsis crispa FD-325 SS-3]